MRGVGIGLVVGALILIVLGFDWLLGSVEMNAAIFDYMMPEVIVSTALETANEGRSCAPSPSRAYGDNIDDYFRCEPIAVATGNPTQCEAVSVEAYISRKLPFTTPTLDALLYVNGSGVGALLADQLRGAHGMKAAQLAQVYPQTRGMHAGFLLDPSPDIAFLDCPGYSILKLRIQR